MVRVSEKPPVQKFYKLGKSPFPAVSVSFDLQFVSPLPPQVVEAEKNLSFLGEENRISLSHTNFSDGKEVTHLYLPASYYSLGNIYEGEGETILTFPNELLQYAAEPIPAVLQFRRRDSNEPLACARHGEEKCFGFSLGTRVKGDASGNYVRLAFPGLSGEFSPLFLKWQENTGKYFYFRVDAMDNKKLGLVVVRAVQAPDAAVPPHLKVIVI